LLRALPGNGRNLTPSSPRYFHEPVGHTKEQSGFRRTTRLGPARTGDANGAHLRPGSHRAASSPARTEVPHAPPALERTLCTRRALALRACALRPSFRPDAAASTASRPADRDDREPPLSSGRDEGNIILVCGFCQDRRSTPFITSSPRGRGPITSCLGWDYGRARS
jgi:hypothetical protein